MSAINKMLQDLDRRGASARERGSLPEAIRALPARRSARRGWWALGGAAGALAVAASVWAITGKLQRPAPVPPIVNAAAAPPQAPAPVALPDPAPEALTPVVALPAAPAPQRLLPPPLAPEASQIPADQDTQTSAAPEAAPARVDKQVQELTPEQLAENEYRAGANSLHDGRIAAAQQKFAGALERNPAHARARQALFGLLLNAKRLPEAEQVLQQGLAIDVGQPGFAMALARLQVERSDTAAAIETLQRSASAAARQPEYLAFLAALLQRQERHAEAVEQYRGALSMAPATPVWLIGLGISLDALHRAPEAYDAFAQAKASRALNGELLAFVDEKLRQLQRR